MQMINHTPFVSGMFVDLDRNGVETLVVMVKATYEFGGGKSPRATEMQQRLVYGDVFAGAAGASSVIYESDANWGRQGTDVSLRGYAYPRRAGDAEVDVSLRVGPVAKEARVFGDRRWERLLGVARMTRPQPFDRIPLVYERAFGGFDDTPSQPGNAEGESRNPVGAGFLARRSRKNVEGMALPNIEDPRKLIQGIDDRPDPVGFTCVAKGWKPRTDFAGTYDEAWQKERMPLLPNDFDARFYVSASAGLDTAEPLRGGEGVELRGLTPAQYEGFELPTLAMAASFLIDATVTPVPMRLDVVQVDAVNSRLVLVWHGSHPIQGQVDDVRWVRTECGAIA